MSRYIDVDELKDYINGNEEFIDWQKKEIIECLDCCDTIGWVPCNVRFPDNEVEVELSIERHANGKVYKFTCRGIHEDGKMLTKNSRSV